MTKWKVVGGGDKGGILVRKGYKTGAESCGERLATGSVVEELEIRGKDERMKYKLLEGEGPETGWVMTSISGKTLLELVEEEAPPPPPPRASTPPPSPKARPKTVTSHIWDFELPEETKLEHGSVEDAPEGGWPLGSRWRPRWSDPPPPEAPLTKGILDYQNLEDVMKVPRCIFNLRQVMKFKDFKDATLKILPGVHWGIPFPHNFELIEEAGPEWLTKAFHRCGTLPMDNKVIGLKVHPLSVDSTVAESMGGQGMKGWLRVWYEKPHPALHTELFVKCPFPYTPQNERAKNSYHAMPDESEILINRMLGNCLPFKIPKYYYGDISYESSNYVLISEKLPYKTLSWLEGGKDMKIEPFEIEPRIVKFKDYEMPLDGYEQYAAAMRALGRMVAVYHSDGLGSKDVLRYWIPRGSESPLEGLGLEKFEELKKGDFLENCAKMCQCSPQDILAQVQQQCDQALQMSEMFGSMMVEFVMACAGIFPEVAKDKAYMKQWWRESMEAAYYSWEMTTFTNVDPVFTSLVHSNLAADNAWYWKDDKGVMQCGLLDFGGSGFQNIATNMQMSWTMGEPAMLKAHFDDLGSAFVDGVRSCDGPASITYEYFQECVNLSFARTSALCGGNVNQLLKIHKKAEWAKFKSRWDPEVNDAFLPRNYTCAMRTMLLLWKDVGLYDRFKKWKSKNEHWFPKGKKPFTCPNLPASLA
mmetsp:Transcript_130113/g.277987  ORF Transcript_130113/g.277987 Transcript_130113/m.277987 type:complete len:700 (-) Transcript_130113:57-2156(-)